MPSNNKLAANSQYFSSILDAVLPDKGLAVVLHHVYFDESGTHEGSRVMTLAAYVFEKRKAQLFSRDWQKDLNHFQLSAGHMTDCALGFGEYAKLTKPQRIDAQTRLIKHIRKRSLVGISVSIDQNEYDRVIAGVPFGFSAYTCLLLLLVEKIGNVLTQQFPDGKVAYFFEAGHDKQSEANEFMNVISKLGLDSKLGYVAHSFVDKAVGLPLQAADMLAWHYRHYLDRLKDGHTKPRADYTALIREQDLEAQVTTPLIQMTADLLKTQKSLYDKDRSEWFALAMKELGSR